MNTKRLLRLFSIALVLFLLLASMETRTALAASTPLRINAGSTAPYTDGNGNTWLADELFAGGSTYSTTNPITGTPAPRVFQTERWGTFAYNIPVANGNYNVNLDFAETVMTGPGQRLFNVSINGTSVLTNFDIYATAGGINIAVVKTFPVTVTNGTLNINFTPGAARGPTVDGIEVLPASVSGSLRINAGSTTPYTDGNGNTWLADEFFNAGSTQSTTNPITGTPAPRVFQTERWGTFAYNIPVADGNYNVNLDFAETVMTGPGQRLFNVSINGTSVLTNFDIYATAGGMNIAVVKTFPVTVINGTLNISFTHGAARGPTVDGIEVLPAPSALAPPTITTQPANQTVAAGQTATFSAAASGTAPLNYQWQKNGANISGATSASYTTPATTTGDSGSTFQAVVSNAAGTVTSSAATLTVSAVSVPGIQISSSSVSFGNDPVGTKISQALSVTNTGSATLSITQLTASGSTAFTVSGFSLPLSVSAGQKATFTANFLPASIGSASGSISIVSNASTSPTSVSLSGSGIAATYTLSVNPASLSFGNVTMGTSSAAQSVGVTNTGNSNVAVSQVTLTGAGYTVTGGSTPVTVSPSQTLTLTTQFSPTAAGSATGTISIASNATGSPATVSLSGTGVTSVQHSVGLTWGASTSSVSGYNIYRSTVSGSTYTKINSSLLAGLSYTDGNVQSGSTYYYVTTAVDSRGNESVYSNQASATIP